MISIRSVYDRLKETCEGKRVKFDENKPNLRIGHGIAFLFKPKKIRNDKNEEVESFFGQKLADFRTFLKDMNIVCELNPTSNHMLIPSTFDGTDITNTDRSLTAFLKEEIPVVLCTDDDGIWAIRKCHEHHHHVSVAYEYCQAIERGEIEETTILSKLIENGRKYAFANNPDEPSEEIVEVQAESSDESSEDSVKVQPKKKPRR